MQADSLLINQAALDLADPLSLGLPFAARAREGPRQRRGAGQRRARGRGGARRAGRAPARAEKGSLAGSQLEGGPPRGAVHAGGLPVGGAALVVARLIGEVQDGPAGGWGCARAVLFAAVPWRSQRRLGRLVAAAVLFEAVLVRGLQRMRRESWGEATRRRHAMHLPGLYSSHLWQLSKSACSTTPFGSGAARARWSSGGAEGRVGAGSEGSAAPNLRSPSSHACWHACWHACLLACFLACFLARLLACLNKRRRTHPCRGSARRSGSQWA